MQGYAGLDWQGVFAIEHFSMLLNPVTLFVYAYKIVHKSFKIIC